MFRVSGLCFVALYGVIVTSDPTVKELLLEIETKRNATNATLEQLSEVQKEVQDLQRKIENVTADEDDPSELPDEHKQLISDLFNLNATSARLESDISSEQARLDKYRLILLTLDFNTKMMRQEAEFFEKRRKEGDENTCFHIVRNITDNDLTSVTASGISARSGSFSAARHIMVLQVALNKAKLEDMVAEQDLMMENFKLSNKKQFYESLLISRKKVLDALSQTLSAGRDTKKTLEEEVEKKEAELSYLNKVKAELKGHIIKSIETTTGFETQLQAYREGIECYKNLLDFTRTSFHTQQPYKLSVNNTSQLFGAGGSPRSLHHKISRNSTPRQHRATPRTADAGETHLNFTAPRSMPNKHLRLPIMNFTTLFSLLTTYPLVVSIHPVPDRIFPRYPSGRGLSSSRLAVPYHYQH